MVKLCREEEGMAFETSQLEASSQATRQAVYASDDRAIGDVDIRRHLCKNIEAVVPVCNFQYGFNCCHRSSIDSFTVSTPFDLFY